MHEVSVRNRQQEQLAVLQGIWNYVNAGDEKGAAVLNARYDELRDELMTHFGGPDKADVGAVDPSMAQTYSDIYKDEHGFRPRWFTSWTDANKWLDQFRVRD